MIIVNTRIIGCGSATRRPVVVKSSCLDHVPQQESLWLRLSVFNPAEAGDRRRHRIIDLFRVDFSLRITSFVVSRGSRGLKKKQDQSHS